MTSENRMTLQLTIALLTLLAAAAVVSAQTTNSRIFPNPQAAVQAVTDATRAKDRAALQDIFGPDLKSLLSGDEVADRNSFEEFAQYVGQATKLEKETDNRMTLLVGNEEWPFPIPIVKNTSGWSFDTKAGTEEIFNRRIGGNEMAAMLTAQAYAIAQWEYFNGDDRDHDQVSEYAQRLFSSPGRQDGLYWETVADDEPSPLGPLVAFARKEGYTGKTPVATTQSVAPFNGYHFKILTRQGKSAAGGAYDYVINGNMIAGFALVAYPATWGNSGVMTFVINHEGRVYEKNLGPGTAQLAAAMTEYNPDPSWKLVRVEWE
ncbi:MAG TPA: DUF2950 domain-containing protein [Pyrinomonadaceae bacterium]|nr:DUF2950 domain-containing protein [Pyrinomonadaceae bacterium]